MCYSGRRINGREGELLLQIKMGLDCGGDPYLRRLLLTGTEENPRVRF